MNWWLLVPAVWLVAAAVVALVVGRGIRFADQRVASSPPIRYVHNSGMTQTSTPHAGARDDFAARIITARTEAYAQTEPTKVADAIVAAMGVVNEAERAGITFTPSDLLDLDNQARHNHYAARYVTARVAVRTAGGSMGMGPFSAIYAAECAASAIVDEAESIGVDLYPVLFELDEQARIAYIASLRVQELRYLTNDPSSRGAARAELTKRGL